MDVYGSALDDMDIEVTNGLGDLLTDRGSRGQSRNTKKPLTGP